MKKGFCRRLLAIGAAVLLTVSAFATENPENTVPPIVTEAPKDTEAPKATESAAKTEAPVETKSVETTAPVETTSGETTVPAETKSVETTAPVETKSVETTAPAETQSAQTAAPTDTADPQNTTTVPADTTQPQNTTAAPENTDTAAPQNTTAAPDGTETAAPQNTTVAPSGAETAAPTDTTNPGSTETVSPDGTATAAPEGTATAVPDSTATADPDNTDDPDVTDDPNATADPDATDAPNATVGPDATDDPNATIDPDATVDPNATIDPNATVEPEGSLNEGTTITAFAPLVMAEASVEAKPTLEEVLAKLETVLTATLDDETTVQVPVAWSCADYDAEATQYIFVSSMTETAYTLAEGLSMPSFVLRIVEPTQLVCGDYTCAIRGDGSLIIVGWSGTSETVTVPAELDGKNVWGIAKTTFAGNENLTEIAVSAGILALEEGAFANCPKLKKVNIPDSLEYAGGGLFSGSDPEEIRLNISLETETADGRSYHREKIIQNADGTVSIEDIDVSFDRDFTDYTVLGGGKWTVKGNLTVLSTHTAIVSAGGAMAIDEGVTVTVFGSLACAGSCVNSGVVAACSGAASGVNGTVLRDHSWQGTECSVCGARQSVTLTARHATGSVSKVYDGTNAIDIGSEDFVLEGVYQGDDVSIAAINADFGSKDVGDYLVSVSLVLGGEDAAYYSVLPLEMTVTIEKKPVTVTPREGQSKTYGDGDPSLRAGYRGMVSGETLSGKLSRESGESAGKYKITMGNLAEKNPNYAITLGEGVFTIEPKALTAGSVAVAAVANQRYTGSALTPAVEVADGGKTLQEGVDYTLSYSENTEVGTGRIAISGKGNYSGSRDAAFRIIKVSASSGSGFTGGYGSAGSVVEEYDESYVGQTEGILILAGTDYGSILFDRDGSALPFVHYDQDVRQVNQETGLEEVVQKILHIEAQETVDAFGIENEGDYGEPRLRLSMDLARALMALEYTDVYLAVGEAEVRIPLNTLYSEYVGSEGTMTVDMYETRLWPLKQPLGENVQAALAGYESIVTPVHFEVLALPEEIQKDENGEYIGAEDVLSLMDGVTLMFTPVEVPDYQYTEYWTICAPKDEAVAAPVPGKTVFVMDDYEVKGRVQPVFAGSYAIGVMEEVEA